MAIHVLLIEDDDEIADAVEFTFTEHGFAVRRAADGDDGLRLARIQPPDLVLLDLGLPGLAGLDLFQALRRMLPAIPIIIVTARDGEADRVTGLELGADDYVTKPFSPRELVARARTVLRRVRGGGNDGDGAAARLRAGALTLDRNTWTATYAERPVSLARHEFKLIEALVRHPARLFTRAHLINILYEGDMIVSDRTVDVTVKRVRQKLLAVRSSPDPIQTVYGLGYRLNPALETAP